MSMLDDYGQPLSPSLPASSSPGLGTLPPEGGAGVGPPAPAPVTDLSTQATPSLSLAQSPSNPSLGLATQNPDAEYLKGLPTGQKIGLMLQAFGAGVNGQGNPVTELLNNRRRQQAELRAEIGTSLKTIEAGVQVLKGMPPGKARDAYAEMVIRAASAQGMDASLMRDALKSVGTDQESAVVSALATIKNPRVQQMLLKSSMGAQDPRAELFKNLRDKDFMDRAEKVADQDVLPTAAAKMNVISRTLEAMPGTKKDVDGKPIFSMADLLTKNAQLDPKAQLDDSELAAIRRNQAVFAPYGLKTDKSAQVEQESGLKAGTPHSEIAKLNDDLARKRITQDQYNAGVKKALTSQDNKIIIQQQTIDKNTKAATATTELTDEAIDRAAARYRTDGTLPPNLGRGAQSSANTAKILNKAAELAAADGKTAEAERIQQLSNKSDASALTQLSKQEAMTAAFEKNAVSNAKIALDMSAKVGRTGVPVLNRWIVAGMKDVAGDPDVAKFHAANETFVNEYSKIMSGSMGNTAVSDSLRREVHTMLSTANTPEQYKQVVGQMQLEMQNRMKGFSAQRDEITTRMSGSSAAPSTPAASTASAAPTGIPAGSKQVGYTPQGKKVWQDSTGKKWVE